MTLSRIARSFDTSIGRPNLKRVTIPLLALAVSCIGIGPCRSDDPPAMAQTIRIGDCNMRLSFSDDFSNLVVHPWVYAGRGWTAHTPWAGDFGDASFTDPSPDFPFTRVNGVLQIEAKKDGGGHWRSGLLASGDSRGQGFGKTYGYFEMKAVLPKGEGTWPAFWLMTLHPKGANEPSIEIDALEHYGKFPADFHSGYIVWKGGHPGPSGEHVTKVAEDALYEGFHTYGVDVEPDFITYYFDRQPTWRVATPSEHHKPLLILLNLALGSGWPITHTPNPSVMKVAYVHVYERTETPCR